jgi:hypothetical protein
MQYDPHMRKYLAGQAKFIIEDVFEGRFYVRGTTQYIVCDVIAFAEWVIYRDLEKLNGFIKKGEFFTEGKEGRYVGVRNPCTHFSEVVKMNFVESDNQWISHLDNVIQLNCYDLTALRAGGADYDGKWIAV